ncbi:MAG: hypothetical protein K2K58_02985, partial [Muribaculaceae bacterium]|nr:hypothetical protein [Muribaculaceae bacterium]
TAAVFCLWMAYAGGLEAMYKTSVFYLAGIFFFIKARKESRSTSAPIFTKIEKWGLALLIIASVISLVSLFRQFIA